ncbi:MAG: RyR domain-containing protein [Bacillota bacterium]
MTFPNPINTDEIVLSDEIKELLELLAENVHNIWSQGRIKEGWTYGPERNDSKKEHPCLIPYENLPENEKQIDRNTSEQTLKAIIALGYKVEKIK